MILKLPGLEGYPASPRFACVREEFIFEGGGATMKKPNILLGFLAVLGLVLSTGCGRKSEAERTGDKIDRKVENVEDAITDDKPKEDAREAREQAKDEIEDRSD